MVSNSTIQDRKKIKSNIVIRRIIIIGVISLVAFFIVLQVSKVTLYHNGLDTTKRTLILLRKSISTFRDIEGVPPKSLKEMFEYGRANPDSGVTQTYRKEFISNSEDSGQEHNVLNGQGGWYYNSNTGEIKVNLTKPVKKYLKLYFGEERDQIPAEW